MTLQTLSVDPTRYGSAPPVAERCREGRVDRGWRPLLWMVLVNLAGAAALIAAALGGWVGPVFANDVTGLTWVIAGVFLAGLVLTFAKAWKLARDTVCVDAHAPCEGTLAADYVDTVRGRSAGSRAISAATLRHTVAGRIAPVLFLAGSLVLLGLIGTVLGFIIALSGVSAESASNLSQTSAMVSRLIAGMSVALYTTLEGAILNLWLMVNYRILAGAAARFVNGLVALGECNERT